MPKKKRLLKALTDTHVPDTYPDPKRDLRLSRRTGYITVTDPAKRFLPFEVLPNKLDDEIEHLTRVADGTGSTQRLLDGLRAARIEHGHLIEGKHKPKGLQARKQLGAYGLQYAAAWTYAFVQKEWILPRRKRHPQLRKAEAQVKRHLKKEDRSIRWGSYQPSIQWRLLTAHLFVSAYRAKLKAYRFEKPLPGYARFNHNSFYRTWIQPKLSDVSARVIGKPRLLGYFSNTIPRNAYLREVFTPSPK